MLDFGEGGEDIGVWIGRPGLGRGFGVGLVGEKEVESGVVMPGFEGLAFVAGVGEGGEGE